MALQMVRYSNLLPANSTMFTQSPSSTTMRFTTQDRFADFHLYDAPVITLLVAFGDGSLEDAASTGHDFAALSIDLASLQLAKNPLSAWLFVHIILGFFGLAVVVPLAWFFRASSRFAAYRHTVALLGLALIIVSVSVASFQASRDDDLVDMHLVIGVACPVLGCLAWLLGMLVENFKFKRAMAWTVATQLVEMAFMAAGIASLFTGEHVVGCGFACCGWMLGAGTNGSTRYLVPKPTRLPGWWPLRMCASCQP
jgi:hypothetical protein